MQVSVTGLSTILPFVFLSKLKRLLHSINAYRRFLPYTILSAIIKKLFGIVKRGSYLGLDRFGLDEFNSLEIG